MIQFIAMLLMFHQLGFLTLESWWISIAALIVCTGIINAYNFMDGINGITGLIFDCHTDSTGNREQSHWIHRPVNDLYNRH